MHSTRQAAKESGDSHYFTGKACKHGHISPRRTKDGNCVECTRVKATKRYYSDQERFKKAAKDRYHAAPEKHLARRSDYLSRNREKINAAKRAAWPERKATVIAKHNAYVARRKAVDPVFALKLRMRTMIGNCLRVRGFKKNSKTAAILGCTWEEFKVHIERQFLKGMNWENMGEWHIDHIVPMATASTELEAIALNHVSNLRPMWGAANLAKGAQVLHLI